MVLQSADQRALQSVVLLVGQMALHSADQMALQSAVWLVVQMVLQSVAWLVVQTVLQSVVLSVGQMALHSADQMDLQSAAKLVVRMALHSVDQMALQTALHSAALKVLQMAVLLVAQRVLKLADLMDPPWAVLWVGWRTLHLAVLWLWVSSGQKKASPDTRQEITSWPPLIQACASNKLLTEQGLFHDDDDEHVQRSTETESERQNKSRVAL
jgi:hypothetical protein